MKSLIKHILKMVSQPNYAMLMRWIYDGELEDTHDEVYRLIFLCWNKWRLIHIKFKRQERFPEKVAN